MPFYFIKKTVFITSTKLTGHLLYHSIEANKNWVLLYNRWNSKQHQTKGHWDILNEMDFNLHRFLKIKLLNDNLDHMFYRYNTSV